MAGSALSPGEFARMPPSLFLHTRVHLGNHWFFILFCSMYGLLDEKRMLIWVPFDPAGSIKKRKNPQATKFIMLAQRSLSNHRGHNRAPGQAGGIATEGARQSTNGRKTAAVSPKGVAKRNQPGASESKDTEVNQGLCIIRAHPSNPWLIFPRNARRKFPSQKL